MICSAAFSTRARVIVYNKKAVNAADAQNYLDLANPKLKSPYEVTSAGPGYTNDVSSVTKL